MAKSVISCSNLENAVNFNCGDLVRAKDGTVFLITDEASMVVLHSDKECIGTAYDPEDWTLDLVPRGLSVTLIQE